MKKIILAVFISLFCVSVYAAEIIIDIPQQFYDVVNAKAQAQGKTIEEYISTKTSMEAISDLCGILRDEHNAQKTALNEQLEQEYIVYYESLIAILNGG